MWPFAKKRTKYQVPKFKKQPVVLVILDGWGFNRKTLGNAIRQGHTPTFSIISEKYPVALLQASGLAVGLSWGESGNSEVGHLNIGAGRVVQQYHTRITKAIEEGSFYKLKPLLESINFAKKSGTTFHIIGLLTSGTVHADFNHMLSIYGLAVELQCRSINFHVFLDGKDSGLEEGADLLKKLESEISKTGVGSIATVMGRQFAMDRDNNWHWTEGAYNCITNAVAQETDNFVEAIEQSYNQGIFDTKIQPLKNTKIAYSGLRPSDSLFFFNFREDSMRQIMSAFVDSSFSSFFRNSIDNLLVTSMTKYLVEQTAPYLIEPPLVLNGLAETVSKNGKKQFHIAETIKYAHVTFFFNCLNNSPFPNEDDILIESVKDYENIPTMRAHEIAQRVREELLRDYYDLIVINMANADILAHTGNYDATLVGVQTIDQALGNLMEGVLNQDGLMLVTADHGNAESLIYSATGAPESKHNDSPVGCYLIGRKYEMQKTPEYMQLETSDVSGILGDVAPTVLELMGIAQPQEMNGKSLLPFLARETSSSEAE